MNYSRKNNRYPFRVTVVFGFLSISFLQNPLSILGKVYYNGVKVKKIETAA